MTSWLVLIQQGGFLSTPSARRATIVTQRCPLVGRISIHALREEGDWLVAALKSLLTNFYPRPPRGGRHVKIWNEWFRDQFLSTPSARRATKQAALQESQTHYFYPRPPRGGRLAAKLTVLPPVIFLSTPSARRATGNPYLEKVGEVFLSTPSARRATTQLKQTSLTMQISIHALREEGDLCTA